MSAMAIARISSSLIAGSSGWRLRDRNLCAGCVAHALLLRSAHLLVSLFGIENAADDLEELAASVRRGPSPDAVDRTIQ